MSNPVLASFDPFAVHPFTSNKGLAPKPPQPTGFPAPIPNSMLNHSAAAPASPSSSPPSSSSQTPIHAPRPRRANSPGSPPARPQAHGVFVPFRPEQSSPDLPDILLKKKPAYGFSFGSEPSTPPTGKSRDGRSKH
ncbi:hypothetical protein OE88DRAFT_1732470 [Heliocybe sulcata]|uniref:Uncharacterized protein n=1 Tax=Heliocybe sulcata TaxID=5364 RepID=A0A5C3ND18_9AGAM|nr:hypothetical protein OE88DRAFT_1732470 [Heliocybe sulcata]